MTEWDNSWDCQFCKASNQQQWSGCWNCKKDRAASDEKLGAKNAVDAAEVEARRIAHQARQEAAQIAVARGEAGKLDFREILALHVGTTVGMNVKDPVKVSEVLLVSVQVDHFVIKADGLLVRTPYSQILRVTEAAGAGAVKGSAFGRSYDLLVEVFHLVVYKGSIGVGMSIPI